MDYKRRYFESAIRDARAAGTIHAPEPTAKGHMIQPYFAGLLTQVRIQDDVEVLQEAFRGILALLGANQAQAVSI